MQPRKKLFTCFVSCLMCLSSVLAEQQLAGLHSDELLSGHLVIPRRVNRRGEFLTHNLTHHHDSSSSSRSSKSKDLHYKLEVNNETLHIELQPHSEFLTPHLIVERHRRDLRRRAKHSRNTDCHFQGKIRGDSESSVAVSTCGGLVGHIKTKTNEYFIEPSKHHGAYSSGGHPHVVFHGSAVKQKKKHERQSQNHVRSGRRQRHAVSNCGTKEPRRRSATRLEWQPQGKVKIQGGRKMRRHQPRTELKATPRDEASPTESQARFQEQAESRRSQRSAHASRSSRSKRSISSPRHVETLIVADASMVAFHDDVETYILTIMNMVSALYKDPSIGNSIEVVVVKIVLLEEDAAHPGLNLTLNAQQNLDAFCGWQHKLSAENENEAQRHDVAILITRKNICGNNCMTLGLANVGGMCRPKKSCSVNEDNGIMLSHTVAHELGHNFGMFHDSAKIGCHPRVGSIVHIMTPTFGADTLEVSWSNCSRKFITHFLDQGLGGCLDNAPTATDQYSYPEVPAGVLFNAELQCRLQFNVTDGDVGACSSMNEICSTLWCRVDGECVTNMRPTAPGTSCGKHKWCQNGRCVPMQEILPMDGGWGNWSEWSACSRSCGGGLSTQKRECNNPQPANGGVFCIGERKRYEICNKQPCPVGSLSFRAQQCSRFDDVPYQGGTYKWQPFFDKHHPCKLFCTDVDDAIIANWGDVVADGTPCKLGTKDMCIDGICKEVGCDWTFESDLQEDRCGVCGGNGEHCKPVKGVFNEPFNVTEGYVEVITIPAKARHIIIKELSNAAHFLSIAKANSSQFYLNGESLISMPGEFVVAGADCIYDRVDEQETIHIPLPIELPIALYVVVRGSDPNEGIYYEFSLPTVLTAARAHSYTWQLGKWTPCSTSCGGGVQYREPICQGNGRVTPQDELCWSNAQNARPAREMRSCNEHQCPAQWWAGPWQFCPATCVLPGAAQHFKRRSVVCLDQHEVVVDDSACSNATRPAATISCGQFLPICRSAEKMKKVILMMQHQ